MEQESEHQHPMAAEPSEHSPSHPPHHAAKKAAAQRKKLLLVGGIALAVLAVAGALFLVLSKGDAKKSATQTPAPQQSTPTEQLPATPTDATPVTFTSTKLNIELTHRKDWTLKEAADGALTITSPRTAYAKADNTAATGVFTLKVRKGSTEAMKAALDAAIASRDSKVIAYSAPTEQQRYYTNVSYGGPTKDSFGFFIVTGSAAFKAGAPFAYALTIDAESFLIAGGFGADKSDSLGFEAVAIESIDSDTVEAAIRIVESLKIF